jgi:hypothetical protein
MGKDCAACYYAERVNAIMRTAILIVIATCAFQFGHIEDRGRWLQGFKSLLDSKMQTLASRMTPGALEKAKQALGNPGRRTKFLQP